ncbi:hypothetical protein [Kitasatospora sp. NBC_00458]|uniref:hypothetical protein n=1 Tax=Kitasatospora sp. NBC_00458 TaxID=2903568 RepID=UPI002E19C736
MSYDVPPSGHTIDETFLHDAPIFAQLARTWAAAGRTVPGHPDHEWLHLVAPPGSRPPTGATPPPAPGPPTGPGTHARLLPPRGPVELPREPW